MHQQPPYLLVRILGVRADVVHNQMLLLSQESLVLNMALLQKTVAVLPEVQAGTRRAKQRERH